MSIRKLDIDDILTMALLVEGYSVTKVSNLLNLTQPAVSQRLRKIEEVFGTKLLDSTYRTAKLTPEAENIGYALVCGLELIAATLPDSLGDGWREPVINLILSEPRDRPASECN